MVYVSANTEQQVLVSEVQGKGVRETAGTRD